MSHADQASRHFLTHQVLEVDNYQPRVFCKMRNVRSLTQERRIGMSPRRPGMSVSRYLSQFKTMETKTVLLDKKFANI